MAFFFYSFEERPVVFRTRAKRCETSSSSSPAPSTNVVFKIRVAHRGYGIALHCRALTSSQRPEKKIFACARIWIGIVSARFSPPPFFNSTNPAYNSVRCIATRTCPACSCYTSGRPQCTCDDTDYYYY
jgi:hypothetical protein